MTGSYWEREGVGEDYYFLRVKSDGRDSKVYPHLVEANLAPGVKPGEAWGLDFGCGSGDLIEGLLTEGFKNVLGIDLGLRSDAFPEWERSRLIIEGGCELPFARNSLDFITAISAVEHAKEVGRVFKEFGRVLKPGSPLVVHIPPFTVGYFVRMIRRKLDGGAPWFSGEGNYWERFWDRRDGDPSHVTWFTPKSILETMTMHGFVVKEVLPFLLKSRIYEQQIGKLRFIWGMAIQEVLNRGVIEPWENKIARLLHGILRLMATPLSVGYTVVGINDGGG